MAKRSHLWMFKYPDRYLKYENTRATYQGKKHPLCEYCRRTGSILIRKRIDRITAMYHYECIPRKFESVDLIDPERRKQLLQLSES